MKLKDLDETISSQEIKALASAIPLPDDQGL
jgi:hypothetical protein